MPLYGTLKCMPLPDVLQWLSNARVTGTLRVERERVSKSIHLRDGLVVGCSSDDPPQRLGHFLFNRGQITEEQLREALQLQEISGQHLGMLLVQLGALSADELSVHLEAQAEETIYSLFDWDDALFRFQENEVDPANMFPVSLRVDDILLRGLKRFDEMREIRGVFDDPGIVLEKTDGDAPATVTENPMGGALWDLINGERTVAEILLQVHGSEYVVTKFLFELYRAGMVRKTCVKPVTVREPQPVAETSGDVEAASAQAPDVGTPATEATAEPTLAAQTDAAPAARTPAVQASAAQADAAPAAQAPAVQTPAAQADAASSVRPESSPAPAAEEPPLDDMLFDFETEIDRPAGEDAATTDGADSEDGAESAAVVAVEDSPAYALGHGLEKARRLMAESHFEKALELLERLYNEQPGEESVRRVMEEAEAAFVEKAYRHFLPPSKVLILTRMMESLETEDLTPSEFFLLSRIDGTWDIKSIIQIAPLRESDALRTLKRMRENGLIELVDP